MEQEMFDLILDTAKNDKRIRAVYMNENDTVLITGASGGIGYELAKIFAENNYNIVLVARSVHKLKELSQKLKNEYGIEVYIIVQDLSEAGAAQKIYDDVKEMPLKIDILVNNAGAGYVGLFHEKPLDMDLRMIQLNITTLTELTKLFAREMVKRKKGKILNVASTGSFEPGPFTAVYYATKAYVLSFSEAIYRELKPYNITVTALCPGATKTNFAENAGKRDSKISMAPNKVAKAAYKALMENKRIAVPGIMNKIFIMLPRNFTGKMVGKYQKNLIK